MTNPPVTVPGLTAIIIPTLNEAAHIGALLDTLAVQEPARVIDIIVVDGGSEDGTQALVAARNARDPRIRLIENIKRLQSPGVNLAASRADPRATILIRVDAHARYPRDFVQTLLAEHAVSGAESVVNQMHSVGRSCFQRAVAAVTNSAFGTGGATHRVGGTSRFVDHGHHALFDRATFVALGGYDESFVANEDAEYDGRLRASGGRIWFTSKAVIDYYPRSTPRALARQYLRYGEGRARTRAKLRERLRLRQMIPPAMVFAVAVSLILSLVLPLLLIVPLVYLLGVTAATAILICRTRDGCTLGALVALPVIHFAWGIGFISGTIFSKVR